jgi:NAD(P)H dehydrogenase (quinone)
MNRRVLLKETGIAVAAASLFVTSASQAQAQTPGANVLVTYHSETGNTEKMAQGVAEGAKTVAGTNVVLKKVSEVTAEDLLSATAVIVGSPIYFANVSGEVKTFLDNWRLKFGIMPGFKMRNKVGAAFVTGASPSSGKETTILAIMQAMLINQMIAVSGGGGFGASATTGPDSPGIDEKEMTTARDLGKRVAEVAVVVKRGSA